MLRRSLFGIVPVLLLMAASSAAFGAIAYQAGLARGLAEAARLAAPAGPPAAALPAYPMLWPGWWGALAFLNCLLPLVVLIVFVAVLQGVAGRVWRGQGRAGWGAGHGLPARFDAWHRRAHGQADEPEDAPGQPA